MGKNTDADGALLERVSVPDVNNGSGASFNHNLRWLVSSLYAAMCLCSACVFFVLVVSDVNSFDWNNLDNIRLLLWSLAAALGFGVALTAYVVQSNRIATAAAVFWFLFLVLPNRNLELAVALTITLSFGLLVGWKLNSVTQDTVSTFRGFALRVGALIWAACVLGLSVLVIHPGTPLVVVPCLIAQTLVFSFGLIIHLYSQYQAGKQALIEPLTATV